MIYYECDNKLFSTETPITDKKFVQITEEEYSERLKTAVNKRRPSSIFVADVNTD